MHIIPPCCDKWAKNAEVLPLQSMTIEPDQDGTWSVDDYECHNLISGIKHCPFCGASVVFDPKLYVNAFTVPVTEQPAEQPPA